VALGETNTTLELWLEAKQVISDKDFFIRDQNMVSLLHILRDRQCEQPRDQICSLQSIAHNGYRNNAYYGKTVSECLIQIPTDLSKSMCLFFMAHLAGLLGQTRTIIIDPLHQLRAATVVMTTSHLVKNIRMGLYMLVVPSKSHATEPNKTFGCSTWKGHVHFDTNNEYFICFTEQCRNTTGSHLVVREDAKLTRVYTYTCEEVVLDYGGMRLTRDKPRSRDSIGDRNRGIRMKMRLSSWIQLALCRISRATSMQWGRTVEWPGSAEYGVAEDDEINTRSD
jgi:hypothetical protein